MRRLVVAATLLLVASTLAAGGVQQTPDADNTVTRVAVQPDGDAEWTVTVRTRLETEAEVRAYEEFQSRFRENSSRYVSPFRTRIEGVVSSAAETTGRQMEARNVTGSTAIRQLPRRWGVVVYSFTWTQFAATDRERLTVGDVFAGGFFLAENDTLVVATPPGYTPVSVDPAPDGRTEEAVRWQGQRDFPDERPTVRFTRAATATDGDATGGSRIPPSIIIGVLLALLAAGGVGAYLYRTRGDLPLVGPSESGTADDGSPDSGAAATPDPTLTDGERVERLLAEHDGRLKQAEIAEEFGWSPSKTSRVVSRLTEETRVEKLRIGRENVVSLVEEE
jgi:hypothetical protein